MEEGPEDRVRFWQSGCLSVKTLGIGSARLKADVSWRAERVQESAIRRGEVKETWPSMGRREAGDGPGETKRGLLRCPADW